MLRALVLLERSAGGRRINGVEPRSERQAPEMLLSGAHERARPVTPHRAGHSGCPLPVARRNTTGCNERLDVPRIEEHPTTEANKRNPLLILGPRPQRVRAHAHTRSCYLQADECLTVLDHEQPS